MADLQTPPEIARRGILLEPAAYHRKQITNVLSIGVPLAGSLYAIYHFRSHPLTWVEVSCFLIFYSFVGIGIGLGFHRCITHQAFRPRRWLRNLFIFAGSLACQGPVIRWIADHRRHHRYADSEWDTHSPLYTETQPYRSRWRGLWHAHMGWMFDRTTTDYRVYAPDLLRDRDCVLFERFYPLWMALSLGLPWLYGYVIAGPTAAIGCLLLGGCVRTTVFHHVTWGVNSLGHTFGRRDASERDHSRNNFWLALVTFGEGWHNNHHAVPRAAYIQWKWYQIDMNGWIVRVLERCGLLTDVVDVPPSRRDASREDVIAIEDLDRLATSVAGKPEN